MPWPSAQAYREDREEIQRMIDKYDRYFKDLTTHDPYKILEITLLCYHLKYAMEWFQRTHDRFEQWTKTETMQP